jgi:hypothetical protein
MFGDNNLYLMDHSLQLKHTFTLNDVTAVPAIAGFLRESSIGLLRMKEEKQKSKYSYFYSRKKISQDKLIDSGDYPLDSIPSAGPQNRIPGLPAWLSDSNSAPIAVQLNSEIVAICIKGGLINIDTRKEFEPRVIPIDSAGRPEAIMFSSNGQIFCAHSHVNNQSLLVTRIGFDLQGNKSISLPGPVINMTTDTRQMEVPTLQTKNDRAVSLVEPAIGAICVSHGKTIYAINKSDMSVSGSVTVDLPCRIISAKYDRAPHERHPIFGGAAPCLIVYAVGATYTGSGGRPQSQWKTELYKLGFE